MTLRRYYKLGDFWLARVDGNPPALMDAEASRLHAESEYAVTGLVVVDVEDNTDPRSGPLTMPPSRPPGAPSPRDLLRAELQAATTLAQLKAVLEKVVG